MRTLASCILVLPLLAAATTLGAALWRDLRAADGEPGSIAVTSAPGRGATFFFTLE